MDTILDILLKVSNLEMDIETAEKKIKELQPISGRLDFREIENLVLLKHFDDDEYGNSERECSELIENSRKKIGYNKNDVKKYLSKKIKNGR